MVRHRMANRDPSDRWRELLSDDPRRIKKNMAQLLLQQLQRGSGDITHGYFECICYVSSVLPIDTGKSVHGSMLLHSFCKTPECCWFFMSLGICLHRMQMHHWVFAYSILCISAEVEVANPASVTPPKNWKTLQGCASWHSWPVFWWPGHQVVALFPVFKHKSREKER